MTTVQLFTKLYALLYFSWTEANLVKLVHTPNGFNSTEKTKILSPNDIILRWKRCVTIAFEKLRVQDLTIQDEETRIHKLINAYFETQAKLRNKIAHGQWINPLSSNNLQMDPDIKIYLDLIDVIQIDIWFEVAKEMTDIVNGLIDARNRNGFKAHYSKYYGRLIEIQNIITQRASWTIEDKKRRLKLKTYKPC